MGRPPATPRRLADVGLLCALACAGCGPDWDSIDPSLAGPKDPTCAGAGCFSCETAADCPVTDDPCQKPTCVGGFCGVQPAPERARIEAQTPGDCRVAVCDGAGGVVHIADDTDVPDDGLACTVEACADGDRLFTHRAAGDPCAEDGGTMCDGQGACVACLAASHCGVDTPCQTFTCEAGACGSATLEVGAACGGGGRCDGGPTCVACAPAQAATFSAETAPLPIPDADPAGVAVSITAAALEGALVDLDVTLALDHGAPGDLEITLTAPSGEIVALSRRRGGLAVGAFQEITFDDDAPLRVTEVAFSPSVPVPSAIPEQSLGRLHGQPAVGAWLLRMVDANPNGITGHLLGASLTLTAQPGNVELPPITFTSDTPLPIPALDPAGVRSQIDISGVPGVVHRATVTLDLVHPDAGEIVAALEAPGGATIPLTTRNGDGMAGVFAGTTFDDLDPLLMGCAGPGCVTFTNNVVLPGAAPEGALSALAGAALDGAWRLWIVDDKTGKSGTLEGWSLTLTPLLCPIGP